MSEEQEKPTGEEPAGEGEERPVIVTIDNRFIHGNGTETCVTKLTEAVEVKKFETRPAVVKRGYGVTINQGNYESARIDVSVEVPCLIQDVALADKWAAKFIEERLLEEVTDVKGGKPPEKKKKEQNFF
jgi:hypothetical protein